MLINFTSNFHTRCFYLSILQLFTLMIRVLPSFSNVFPWVISTFSQVLPLPGTVLYWFGASATQHTRLRGRCKNSPRSDGIGWGVISMDQWIGLRDNLQEKPWKNSTFPGNIDRFRQFQAEMHVEKWHVDSAYPPLGIG